MPAMISSKQVFLALATFGFASLVACGGSDGAAKGDAAKDGAKKGGEEEMVDVFKDGAMQRISLQKLDKKMPAEEGKVMPGVPNQDAIVGWYDTGHNYHAEKMNTKDPGQIAVDPAAERGITLTEGQVVITRNGQPEAINFKDLESKYADVASKLANPGGLVADAIVGWYDSGHNYHAEKMGTKGIGEIVVDPAAQKGVVVGQ